MGSIWQTVEHWVSGEPYTQTRRDAWLRRAVDVWARGWTLETRLGDRGKPINHDWYPDEAAARAALAEHMETAEHMWGGADWHLMASEPPADPGHSPTSSPTR